MNHTNKSKKSMKTRWAVSEKTWMHLIKPVWNLKMRLKSWLKKQRPYLKNIKLNMINRKSANALCEYPSRSQQLT
nr:hypothetical protein [Bacillus subtilis]